MCVRSNRECPRVNETSPSQNNLVFSSQPSCFSQQEGNLSSIFFLIQRFSLVLRETIDEDTREAIIEQIEHMKIAAKYK